MQIGKKVIGKNNPVFLIAEAGVNYNNDLRRALKMVDIAKKSGADAIKFQSWKTDKLLLKTSKKPMYQNTIKNKTYYQLLKSLEPEEKHQKEIFEYCKNKNILFLSTPYDEESIEFLNDIGVSAFKVSSTDFSNHMLLEHICKKNKPIILSTGLSTSKEVDTTIKFLTEKHFKNKTILLHTTSDYPTKSDEVNLKVLLTYQTKYKMLVGYSDHTTNEIASLGAVALGAKVLEKHFTVNKKLSGPDQSASLTPKELKKWVENIRTIERMLGNRKKIITKSEKKNLSMRKVLMIKEKRKHKKIEKSDLIALRTDGSGILPTKENIDKVLDKKLKKNIKKLRKFSWDLI